MTHHYLDTLVQAGQEKGFKVEQDVDYGAGPVDIVWNVNVQSSVTVIHNSKITYEQRTTQWLKINHQ